MGIPVGGGVDDDLQALAPARRATVATVECADIGRRVLRRRAAAQIPELGGVIGRKEDIVVRQIETGTAAVRQPHQCGERARGGGLGEDGTPHGIAEQPVGQRSGIAIAHGGRQLTRGADPLRLAGLGAVAGVAAFLMTLFAAPLVSVPMLYAGAACIGFGTGLFSVGTMIAAMGLAEKGSAGLALGAWGAVQASSAGLGVALGGLVRDAMANAALRDALGATLAHRSTGYGTVYCIEIALLLVAMVVLGPVVGAGRTPTDDEERRFGLSEFPT